MANGQEWEYRVEQVKTLDADELTQIINKRAEDGWEFVSADAPFLYFRRIKQSGSPPPEQDPDFGLREIY